VGEDGVVHEYAITVIGRDRPGIIAETAEILAGLGCNLTDSTMTRLRGHFAMTLVCAGEARSAEVEVATAALSSDGSLVVAVRELGAEPDETGSGGHYVLSLHGADRLGIVAAVARLLADVGGNITDLTTRLSGDLYVLVAEVDLPSTVDIASLANQLGAVAADLGVEAQLRRADTDLL
jgi:glycine cleavage system transcriptional repressor